MTINPKLSLSDQLKERFEVSKSELKEPYAGVQTFYSVEYEYDSYVCTGYQCGQGDDDYCRDSEYENIRIEGSVNVRAVLAEIFKTRAEAIPNDLVKIAENELNLHEAEAYEVEVSNGYYGEEAKVVLSDPETVMARLREYFFSQSNAVDDDEILPYLRGKGLDTAALTPLEALKKQLREENHGKIVGYVENCAEVSRKSLKVSEVTIPQMRHFVNIESRSPEAPKGTRKTYGVVVRRGNEHVLVDGYHRIKHAKDAGIASGSFIVLA